MKKAPSRSVCFIVAVVLAMSLVPLPAFAERAVAPSESWVDEIESMLAAGDYAEGEVIVGFQEVRSVFGLTPQPGEPYGAESLLEVDASVVDDEAAGVSTPAGTIFPAQSAADGGDVQISLIESDSLSTRELLYQLADDPHVVFAEPNYITEPTAADAENDAAAEASRA